MIVVLDGSDATKRAPWPVVCERLIVPLFWLPLLWLPLLWLPMLPLLFPLLAELPDCMPVSWPAFCAETGAAKARAAVAARASASVLICSSDDDDAHSPHDNSARCGSVSSPRLFFPRMNKRLFSAWVERLSRLAELLPPAPGKTSLDLDVRG